MKSTDSLTEIEPLGGHTVRGKAAPVQAFRILSERAERTPFDASRERGLTRMTGRRWELDQLIEVARDAAGGVVRTAIVEGDAGVGKSRLCHEFGRTVEEAVEVPRRHKGRCQPYGTVTPFFPFVHVLRSALGTTRRGNSDQIGAAIARFTANEPRLDEYAPAYLYLLSACSSDSLPEAWRGDDLPVILQRALVELISAVGRRGFTIIELDDWHWADMASVGVLNSLTHELADAPIMLLVSQRPGIDFDDHDATVLRLETLTARETASLIARYFEAEMVEESLAAIVQERTLGNPLFVEEVCSDLRSKKRVSIPSGKVIASGDVDALELPTTVQAVILGRVDTLSPSLRETVRIASVIGREFDFALLAQLVENPDLNGQIDDLVQHDVIEAMAEDDGRRCRFRHVIIQSTIYDSLLHSERSKLHARIAALIELGQSEEDGVRLRNVEALAHHYAAAGERTEAIRYLELAGRKALDHHALDAARQQYKLAIDLTLTGGQTPELREQRARLALSWAEACIFSPSDSQIELLSNVHDEAHEDGRVELALFVQYWTNWVRYSIGQIREAEQGTRDLLEQATDAGSDRMSELANCHLGQVLVASGSVGEAIDRLEAGTRRRTTALDDGSLDRASVSGMYCYSLAQLGLALVDRGDTEEGFEILDSACDLVQEAGASGTEAALRITRARASCTCGRWDAARADLVALSAIHDVSVSRYVRIMQNVLIAYVDVSEHGSDHLPALRRAVEAHAASEAKLVLPGSLSFLAGALLELGRMDEARVAALEALDPTIRGGSRGTAMAAAVLIRTSGLSGAELDREVASARETELRLASPRGVALIDVAAALTHLGNGDIEAARLYAEAALGAANLLSPAQLRLAEAVLADPHDRADGAVSGKT